MSASLKLLCVTLLFQSISSARANVAQDALMCVRQFLTRFAVRMETPTAMSASLKLLRVTLLLQSLSSARANVAQDALRANVAQVNRTTANFPSTMDPARP